MKIGVAMSGGVDSSVALGLLKEQGHEVVGLTLKILPCEITPGENGAVSVKTVEPKGQRCCSVEDIQDARSVALKLGAPHYVNEGLDVFKANVVERFLDEYEQGITPNPCVECNRFAKLPLLLQQALTLGCEKLATGHYARVDQDPVTGRWRLRKALDPDKDQSYVLYKLTQKLLSHLLFPLGETVKAQVREDARRMSLNIAEKPESMEICFVTQKSYRDFVKIHRPRAFVPGDIVDVSGKVLGRHEGIAGYTIGQRKGLNLSGGPYFVVELNPETATVLVGRDEDTFVKEFHVAEMNWVAWEPLTEPREVMAKIRYRSVEQPAVLYPEGPKRVKVVLKDPARAVTPGQSTVFYEGDAVVGGGVIQKPAAR
ncbi:MAG TPA: tRNA 2-thiouridine(34) synthase MnmA [bacterium]|nr:tRNA 2-thiouridine(34) synthase MnmA [bacterium]